MFKEELNLNLDQDSDQKIKTYAEMSEGERREFREEKERELENLKESLVKCGVPVKGTETEITTEEKITGVEFEIEEGEEELRLIIKQEYGESIPGLSNSNSSVWMCLDHKDLKSFEKNQGSNANTNIDFEKEYQGIIFEDIEKKEKGKTKMKIRIAADHPVAISANLFGKNNEVYLPGEFNNWNAPDPLEFNEETGELEGEIVWNKERRAQCKIAIHIKSKFDNGGWRDGADQKMDIDLG